MIAIVSNQQLINLPLLFVWDHLACCVFNAVITLKDTVDCVAGRTALTGGRKSGGVEKREHRSVICEYENNNRTDGCVTGILPEPGLHGKRESWARQYRDPWEATPALSLQDLWEDLQRAGRHPV
jgi:hypothetical protein